LDSYKYGYHSIFLVNDMHKIHYDSPSNDKNADKVSIEGALKKVGMKRIFLPPGSPQLNPV
jgi:transposase